MITPTPKNTQEALQLARELTQKGQMPTRAFLEACGFKGYTGRIEDSMAASYMVKRQEARIPKTRTSPSRSQS